MNITNVDMKKIDLHIHTRASSDGELSGEEILKIASLQGVGTIAITDHDTISEVSFAMEKSEQYGIEVIPGAEIFCKSDGKYIHMLGYYYDLNAKPIIQILDNLKNTRGEWLIDQIKLIRSKGIFIEEEKVFEFCKDAPPLLSAVAYAVLEDERNIDDPLIEKYKKYKDPIIEMSVRLLSFEKPLYTPQYIPEASEFIDAMKKSGGVPVLAHPGYAQMKVDFDDTSFVDRLVEYGLSGIEVYYSTHTREEEEKYLAYCKSRDLIQTVGSDFHGRFKPDITIGQNNNTDYSIIEKLKARRDEIRNQ